MPWRTWRWWSTRAKPRSANGRRRRLETASSGLVRPSRTSCSKRRMAASSTPLSLPVVSDPAQPSPSTAPGARPRVGLLGPPGTFAEIALATQPDLAAGQLEWYRTMPDVLWAVSEGEVDIGLVAIENSIEGTVNITS